MIHDRVLLKKVDRPIKDFQQGNSIPVNKVWKQLLQNHSSKVSVVPYADRQSHPGRP